jgi:hypothetical protein
MRLFMSVLGLGTVSRTLDEERREERQVDRGWRKKRE